jgi:hypothetical protein
MVDPERRAEMRIFLSLMALFLPADNPELVSACFTSVEATRSQLERSSFTLVETLTWADPARTLRLEGRMDCSGRGGRYDWNVHDSHQVNGVLEEQITIVEDGQNCALLRQNSTLNDQRLLREGVSAAAELFLKGKKPAIDPLLRRTPDLIWFTDNIYSFRSIVRHLDGPPVSRPGGKPFDRNVSRNGDLVSVELKFQNGFETQLTLSLSAGGNVVEHFRKEPPQGAVESWTYSKRTYQWESTPEGQWWPKRFERRDTKDSASGEFIFSDVVEVKEFLSAAKSGASPNATVSLRSLGELRPGTLVTEYSPGADPKSYTIGKEKSESFEEMSRRMGSSLRQGTFYKTKTK